MANEVKILISAVDKASGTLNKIQSELTQTGKAGSGGLLSIGKGALAAVGGVAALGGAVMAAANFVKGSVNDWANYNEEIRKLSIATGAAPEDLSRMMQAADDLGVSMDALKTSFAIAARNGVQPTIASIASLSDKLLSIEDPTKRAAEASKLFGRNWKEIAPFILAGGDAIKNGTAAINDNLVATQKSIDESRAYKVQIDNLTDAWTGLKNSIAMEAMPVMTDATGVMNEMSDSIQNNTLPAFFELGKAVINNQTNFSMLTMTLGAYVSGMANGTDVTNVAAAASGTLSDKFTQLEMRTRQANAANYEYINSADALAGATNDAASAIGYASTAITKYIDDTKLAQQASDALKITTGELTLEEIALREHIYSLAQLMGDKLMTLAQWTEAMEVLGGSTMTTAQKIAYLKNQINALRNKTITITVLMNTKGTGTLISPTGAERKPKSPTTPPPKTEEEEVEETAGGQNGLDMIVPPGYDNDRFPIFASSGERAIIVPKNAKQYTGGFEGIGGGGVINYITINQQPGQSAAAVADALIYQMQRASAARSAGIKYAGR